MSDHQAAIQTHYEAGTGPALLANIRAWLDSLPPGPVEPSRLAGLDQFHMGGLAATTRLAALVATRPGTEVLDAGSGLGGPARHLAAAHGCRVTGVDLSPAYVEIATLLAERTGLGEAVRFQAGDLLALPFPPARFDVIWTQHVVMNIADRKGLYDGFRRVLRPAGRLALHDVLMADGGSDPLYPVPWAETPANSTLLTEAETLAVLDRSGFVKRAWQDVTEEALAWISQPRRASPDGATLGSVMGPRFAGMTANFARNLREGRLRIVMGVFEATA